MRYNYTNVTFNNHEVTYDLTVTQGKKELWKEQEAKYIYDFKNEIKLVLLNNHEATTDNETVLELITLTQQEINIQKKIIKFIEEN